MKNHGNRCTRLRAGTESTFEATFWSGEYYVRHVKHTFLCLSELAFAFICCSCKPDRKIDRWKEVEPYIETRLDFATDKACLLRP